MLMQDFMKIFYGTIVWFDFLLLFLFSFLFCVLLMLLNRGKLFQKRFTEDLKAVQSSHEKPVSRIG